MTNAQPPLTNTLTEAFWGRHGIKPSVDMLLKGGFQLPTLIVLYSGMDAIASVSRPADAPEAGRHFIRWCDQYLSVPAPVPLRGVDIYAARCAVIHSFSASSSLSERGKARLLGYRSGPGASEVWDNIDTTMADRIVIVEIERLADAFFDAVARCIPDLYSTTARAELTDRRLRSLLAFLPYSAPRR